MDMFQYEQLSELNEGEFAVYNYVSTHLEEIEQMNIRELSAATKVSTTTILRFCSKFGCNGYKEFKYQLSRSIHKRANQRMYFPDAIHAIQFLQKASEDQSLDAQLEITAGWCLQARQVLFTGVGTSGSLAGFGSRLLSDMGIESFAITDLFYPLPMQDLGDTVLIALSVSGETAGIISMVGGYKKKHTKIISITNTGQCTLAKMSDINFAYYMPLSYSWPRRDTAEQTTQIPPLYLLETLMSKICEKREKSSGS